MTHRLLSRYPNLKGAIFIVTYGRSGSTLLQAIFNTLSGAHIGGENFNTFGGLYYAQMRARRAREVWGGREQAPHEPWHGAERIAPDPFEDALVDAFLDHVLKPPKTARWIGFKEIRHQDFEDHLPDYLDLLRRAFPNTHILFNSRDGDEVSRSAWWRDWPRDEVLAMVARMDRAFASYASHHPGTCHHLFHAQTVADPASLAPVFEALGEPFDIAAVQQVVSNRLTH